MPLHVGINEVRSAPAGSEPLVAQQPYSSSSIIIAVAGSYEAERPGSSMHVAPLVINKSTPTTPVNPEAPRIAPLPQPARPPITPPPQPERPTRFLALLSTDPQDEEDERARRRHDDAVQLAANNTLNRCERYGWEVYRLQKWDVDWHDPARWYRPNELQWCDHNGCTHPPPESTFPGDKDWTFETATKAGPGLGDFVAPDEAGPAAPPPVEETPAVAAEGALGALRGMLRDARAAGLRDVKVGLSVPSGGFCGDELAALVAREVASWEEGPQVRVVGRAFGMWRRLAVLGGEGDAARPFVLKDS